ncbi:MAG TPA: TonB-dependent receptor plug domain-containing protein [Gemmatimonadaceae bacterium]|nr:TonB-dependent receptor plug domain-containing protein [Gemmatimonadaceae bacterium]
MMMPRLHRTRALLLTMVVSMVALWSAAPVAAQVTYTVFPVKLPESTPAAAQPTSHGTGTHVTVVVQDSTIGFIVKDIARQAHLRPSFDIGNPAFAKRISVRMSDVGVLEALTAVLRGTGLVAKLTSDGETLMIGTQSGLSSAQRAGLADGIIVGRVTDSASGAGVGGAAVKVEGTKLSAVTSDSGRFTLKDVPTGEQVVSVKLFGYKPAERPVTVVDSERTTVRITLVPVPTVLSGVVTTATGLQRKVEVGNDVTSLNVDSIMQVAPVMSVTDLLETRVPGLTVLHSSGTPGDPSRLRLRGASTIYGNNDPIVIVDGVRVYASQSDPRNDNLAPNKNQGVSSPVNGISAYAAPSPLDQIDPSSIETIEVMKGPSASALYGSDAANGVIVITTKHGRAGPTLWGVALGQGVNWLPGSWPDVFYKFGSDETGLTQSSVVNGICLWNNPNCTQDSLVAFQALNEPLYTVFAHGSDQTASLTISGGVPTLQYSLSGSAAGDEGNLKLPEIEEKLFEQSYGQIPTWMLRPDNYNNWGVTGAFTASPTPTARVTLMSSLFSSTQQRSSLQSAISQVDGEYVDSTILADASQPFIQDFVQRATSTQLTSTNTLSLSWQPRPWLPLTATGGINTIQRTDVTYIPFGICRTGVQQDCVGNHSPFDTTGSYGLGRGASHDQTLTAGTAIPLFRQRMTLAFGGNSYSESTADFTAYTDQLAPGVAVPTVFSTNMNNSQGVTSTFQQSTTGQSTYGWYVEPRLNFASRFFVAPGFRLDGGSGGSHASYSGAGVTTGSIGGLSAFPKIDLSYVAVDRQSGHPLWGVLSLLRPRVAFGYAGTQPGPADKLRLFNVGNYVLSEPGNPFLTYQTGGCSTSLTLNGDSTFVPAVCLNSLGNTQLRPERSSELEGGIDATLWRGRLTLTYTQYNKTRHDAILSIPVAPSVSGGGLGGSSYFKNIGVIRNTGTELTINAFLLQSQAVSWNVGANLSSNNSLVISLNPGQPPICFGAGDPCQGTQIIAGYPLFGEWAKSIVSFADANHDGIIEPSEVRLSDSSVYVGQPSPKYQFNMTTDIALLHGRLSVHATFAYMNGLTQNDLGALTSGAFVQLPNTPSTPLATQAAVVEAECYQGTYFNGLLRSGCPSSSSASTLIGLYQTVNTFRFQDLSINFQVPRAVASWFRVPHMSLALQGSNLGLHSNYRGMDPNVNAFSTVSAGDETADTGQIPEPRTWWLKLSLGEK